MLVFLGLSVLDLGPMYATDRQNVRQTDVRRAESLNASAMGAGYNKESVMNVILLYAEYSAALRFIK